MKKYKRFKVEVRDKGVLVRELTISGNNVVTEEDAINRVIGWNWPLVPGRVIRATTIGRKTGGTSVFSTH